MDLPVNYKKLHYTKKKEVREEYIKLQNKKCHYCKESIYGEPAEFVMNKKIKKYLFPKGFFDWKIHLHHSHDTGLTVGVVHSHCNAVLWQYHGE